MGTFGRNRARRRPGRLRYFPVFPAPAKALTKRGNRPFEFIAIFQIEVEHGRKMIVSRKEQQPRPCRRLRLPCRDETQGVIMECRRIEFRHSNQQGHRAAGQTRQRGSFRIALRSVAEICNLPL